MLPARWQHHHSVLTEVVGFDFDAAVAAAGISAAGHVSGLSVRGGLDYSTSKF